MKKIRSFSIVLVWTLLLASCEKDVNIDLGTGNPKLVVDGFIETDNFPVVVLTNSFSYFSKIDLSTLENAFIHGAVVKVSDGSREITLREYTLDTGFSTSKYYFYSIDTADPAAFDFKGVAERYYHLSIETGGKTYESTTKIPSVRPMDSIWYEPPAYPVDGIPDAMNVFVRYSDPDTEGNYVRYYTQRNGSLFFAPFNSVYDDQVINGTTFSLSVTPGNDHSKDINRDSASYFFKGDTVTLKWCAIDQKVFNFWSTLEFSATTVGNPFSSPVTVVSNVSNNALGVWAGYGVTYSTVIIPR